jgi:hypothetical protein
MNKTLTARRTTDPDLPVGSVDIFDGKVQVAFVERQVTGDFTDRGVYVKSVDWTVYVKRSALKPGHHENGFRCRHSTLKAAKAALAEHLV